MTRVVTASTDTITLNALDVAEAIDQFIRRCHQDLDPLRGYGSRLYTLALTQAPAHFDVRVAVEGFLAADLLAGSDYGGVTLRAGDRVLIIDDVSQAGVWEVISDVAPAERADDCDDLAEIIAKPYVYVAEGDWRGRWFLLDNLAIGDIADAAYTIQS